MNINIDPTKILLSLLSEAGWGEEFIKSYLSAIEPEPILVPVLIPIKK